MPRGRRPPHAVALCPEQRVTHILAPPQRYYDDYAPCSEKRAWRAAAKRYVQKSADAACPAAAIRRPTRAADDFHATYSRFFARDTSDVQA